MSYPQPDVPTLPSPSAAAAMLDPTTVEGSAVEPAAAPNTAPVLPEADGASRGPAHASTADAAAPPLTDHARTKQARVNAQVDRVLRRATNRAARAAANATEAWPEPGAAGHAPPSSPPRPPHRA
jgi:hypothetical protein